MKFQIGAMTVGDILDRGLKLLLHNLPVFFVINLIVLAPLIVVQLIMPELLVQLTAGPAGPVTLAQGLAAFTPFMVAIILTIILQPVGTAAILHIIAQDFVDRRVSLGGALSFGFSRFGSLLGTSILVGLVLMVGFILCIVPGIIFYIWYVFFAQIVVVEKLSGTTAMQRSKSLTEGYRGRVFGVIVLLIVVGIIFQGAFGLLERVLPSYDAVPIEVAPRAFGQPAVRLVVNRGNLYINTIVTQLANILVQTYTAVCITLFYFDLRIRKEGFDLELAAREQSPGEEPAMES